MEVPLEVVVDETVACSVCEPDLSALALKYIIWFAVKAGDGIPLSVSVPPAPDALVTTVR
jgi:hypothetical protein